MSDAENDADELERIRAEKRERLRKRAERENRLSSSPDAPVPVEGSSHFERLLDEQPILLADFYADWCGPCRMLAPVLDRIAADTPATVCKIDTDALPQLSGRHNVRSLPTLVLFVDGEPAERLVGMQEESRLRTVIERHAASV